MEIRRVRRQDVVEKARWRGPLGPWWVGVQRNCWIRCSRENQQSEPRASSWASGERERHNADGHKSGVKILPFLFGFQLPLTVKLWITLSNLTIKWEVHIFIKSLRSSFYLLYRCDAACIWGCESAYDYITITLPRMPHTTGSPFPECPTQLDHLSQNDPYNRITLPRMIHTTGSLFPECPTQQDHFSQNAPHYRITFPRMLPLTGSPFLECFTLQDHPSLNAPHNRITFPRMPHT